MQGLISPPERKNGSTPAEKVGHEVPDRLGDAEVLDDVREYVVENLGDPDAVLIVNDTGF